MKRFLKFFGVALMLGSAAVQAEDEVKKTLPPEEKLPAGRPDGKTLPKFEVIDQTRVKAGSVVLDKQTKVLSFKAKLNMREGIIEYAMAASYGKGHEALFVTDADPFHITLGLKLLDFKSFDGFFAPIGPNRQMQPNFLPPPRQQYIGSIVQIEVVWQQDGKERRCGLNELVLNQKKQQCMPAKYFLYNDSIVDQGVYQAAIIGDIIAIYPDRAAMFNYTGEDKDDDEAWVPYADRLPPLGTEVTIEISKSQP